jgi:hypothetical protein
VNEEAMAHWGLSRQKKCRLEEKFKTGNNNRALECGMELCGLGQADGIMNCTAYTRSQTLWRTSKLEN